MRGRIGIVPYDRRRLSRGGVEPRRQLHFWPGKPRTFSELMEARSSCDTLSRIRRLPIRATKVGFNREPGSRRRLLEDPAQHRGDVGGCRRGE